ncbi:hypothetical protein MAPG_08351 [Magnaporthiopsis poae ATCC 64411]|uniref:Uncharacterized protein n=1 Tax=Magnaporthiopsis poae (strain ATCC 64411 / 73-15) TaxID=644358 RepID=A0A0C4E750_MAGP6|nr:hypothetical protein MAPG_08351 [Magnaporthiopsis poae ATCC 64411]
MWGEKGGCREKQNDGQPRSPMSGQVILGQNPEHIGTGRERHSTCVVLPSRCKSKAASFQGTYAGRRRGVGCVTSFTYVSKKLQRSDRAALYQIKLKEKGKAT